MISFDFSGKVAIVTGAAAGIGKELCRSLLQAGCAVVLNDVNEEQGDIVHQQFEHLYPGKCKKCIGDASRMEVIKMMVETAETAFGTLDYIIANAGITTYGDFLEYQEEDFQRLMEVNLKGSFFLARQGALAMKEKGGGKIFFMSSVTAHRAHPFLSAYGMTKAALEALARNLSVELAPFHIIVNAVAPGATLTERTLASDEAYEKVWKRITPSGKVTLPSDIAQSIMFLLSDAADQITGQSLIVDGGWTNVSPPPEF